METKIHEHSHKNFKNMLLERKHLGKGVYFQRGICKGIQVGDFFVSTTAAQMKFKVAEISILRDAKGVFENKKDSEMSYYEAKIVDESFSENIPYTNAVNIG